MYYSRYPKDWKEISLAIRRDRAKWCCEWCGVRNGAAGLRSTSGMWVDQADYHRIIHTPEFDQHFDMFGLSPKVITIVLTVAHLGVPYPDGRPGDKHDKADCRPENLAALCQRCHLNFDRADHVARAAATRERKRQERGGMQLDLFGGNGG